MAGIQYHRLDLRLTIRRGDDGGAAIRVDEPGGGEYAVEPKLVAQWLAVQDHIAPDLSLAPGLGAALAAWSARVASPSFNTLPRLVFAIQDANLASLAWEENALFMPVGLVPQTVLMVRHSPVRPRALTLSF